MTWTCTHTGPFDGHMPCTRTDTHETGHTYEAAWLADAHDETEARACA